MERKKKEMKLKKLSRQ